LREGVYYLRGMALIGDRERERAAALLGRHYLRGRLSVEELTERLELALAARRDGEVRLALAELPPTWLEQATEARSRVVATWRTTKRAAFVIAVWLLWWTASLVLLTGFVVTVLVQGASSTNAVVFAGLWLGCTFIAWWVARGRPLRRH
jgi:Domain of unknown function (DUF1707)